MSHDQVTESATKAFRQYSQWGSIRGLKTRILPWRLWDKAKKLVWDPADIDYEKDAAQWAEMSLDQRVSIYALASGFMVGEEGVTLDIIPLLLAIADEGRTEEAMFLTTFLFEEAKHVDFFHRWFDAVGIDIPEMDELRVGWLRDQGIEPLTHEKRHYMFQVELPRVMRRLLTEPTTENVLDASVTYNQFVEGCLAIAGYKVWGEMFAAFGVLPGLREGLLLVQRDERRHIAYGTYLCRRILAARPELFEFAEGRMRTLHESYYQALRLQNYSLDAGNGQGSQSQISPAFGPFVEYVNKQVDRRIEVLSKARAISEEEAESGSDVEETEEALDRD